MFFWAALTLGFLGSLHCVGMCGPLALALPLDRNSKWKMMIGGMVYNLGRVLTYALIGLVFGLIGQGLSLAGYQSTLSIVLGVFILLGLLFAWKNSITSRWTSFAAPMVSRIKRSLSKLFKRHSFSSLFLIGLLNGFLPCGLVYFALTGALATGNTLNGMLFMVLFGLGTFPAMWTVNILSGSVSQKFRTKVNKAVPYVVATMALLLILRGMNLGIPYISPSIVEKTDECGKTRVEHDCCKRPEK